MLICERSNCLYSANFFPIILYFKLKRCKGNTKKVKCKKKCNNKIFAITILFYIFVAFNLDRNNNDKVVSNVSEFVHKEFQGVSRRGYRRIAKIAFRG
ncbi:MAG: hypothetical protein J6T70_05685 [Bacteroidales bacterium]|nr:hypothetical protein [Bacteroidales bacterium]